MKTQIFYKGDNGAKRGKGGKFAADTVLKEWNGF